jgi:hypothetical protein
MYEHKAFNLDHNNLVLFLFYFILGGGESIWYTGH